MRSYTTLLVLLLALVTFGSAQAAPYGWTLSASSTDPYQNSPGFTPGLTSMYLWFVCGSDGPAGPGGMSAAQFKICPDNTANPITAVTMRNGFLNAGSIAIPCADLLVAVGACPLGPVVAAEIFTIQAVPGQFCFGPSTDGQGLPVFGTVDCAPQPALYGMDWIGLDAGTGLCASPSALCQGPVSVENSSWGHIKGLYR